MTITTESHKLVFVRTGLAIAAFALASCAAHEPTSNPEMAGYTQAASKMSTLSSAEQPMAVFIDGPTGYTFVWKGDTGWKFVGHYSDSAH